MRDAGEAVALVERRATAAIAGAIRAATGALVVKALTNPHQSASGGNGFQVQVEFLHALVILVEHVPVARAADAAAGAAQAAGGGFDQAAVFVFLNGGAVELAGVVGGCPGG